MAPPILSTAINKLIYFILSVATLSVIIIVISWLIEIMGNQLDDGGFFIIAIAIITLSTLAGKWLKGVAKQFSEQSHE